MAEVITHEVRHLPTHLQIRHITVEVDPVQTLQIQHHMPIKKIVHRRHRSHTNSLTVSDSVNQPSARRSEAKPHWVLRPEKPCVVVTGLCRFPLGCYF